MPRLPSSSKNQEEKNEVRTLKKKAVPKKTGKGRKAGAARQPRALQCQLLQQRGRDPEHPIMIDDEVNEEYKVRDDQSAMMPLRRSLRFHQEDKSFGKLLLPPNCQETSHNRKAQNSIRKDKNQVDLKRNRKNAGLKPLEGMKSYNKPHQLCKDPQDILTRKKVTDVPRMKSEKQEVRPSHSVVRTGKRKRGTEGRSSQKRRSYKEPKSLPAYCQENEPSNEPKKAIHKKIEKDPSIVAKPKAGHERLINTDEPSRTEREGMENFCGADDWTEEQDMALRKAYFTARPSPHFWKRVSKLVPGRSAKDCFNRIHADLSTPTPIAPRPRTSKTTFSPIGNFSLSDPKLPNLLESTVGRQRTAKQKSLATQKTVRHLLQKHCLIDQAQESDHFSLFETSPSAFQLNIPSEYSPRTPESYLNSVSLGKCSGSLSARKRPFSRLRAERAEPSPAVLKPIKNVILHEKYVDQLSRREGTKRPRKRTLGSKGADSATTLSRQEAGGLKAAKNALISEATDFISQFKKLQANSLVHIVENREDDDIECDASDNCHDDDKE
ncbi:hypothetical protein C2845_PM06G20560 [Panicum miliaceum]|uniref:Myb-like domain-containing protein n=1 Tax=Panicum miliaceum TaxID=4540 RepID=A0A3L6R5J7_PANMI|nr:hypothetical protein C2845_PM06G20560 [Panicum miliaceum]